MFIHDRLPNNLHRPAVPLDVHILGADKVFGQKPILKSFDLTLKANQFTALLGANGCGKSTLMSLLAGVTPIDRGQISMGGMSLRKKRIGYIFQNYRASLFPWLTGQDNILYPLKVNHVPKKEQQKRLDRFISHFDIRLNLKAYPYQYSGGQQQFIAILRALITLPDLLLLDEPFASLDLQMTLQVREKLGEICRESGLTTLMTSHDLDDAIYLADRIIILTGPPSTIASDLTLSVNHPRKVDLFTHPELLQIRQQCLAHFLV
jgi:NitT/TauT family transport system ATP-binding protein